MRIHVDPGEFVESKILFVDDDVSILQGYRRMLHSEFLVRTAIGGEQGLRTISTTGPFAVVISDMRMPGMSGAEFLAKVRQNSPDTVRMLLTGYSELDAAIEAVNKGSIFRYLSKPCEMPVLVSAIESGLAVYRSAMASKELIKKVQLVTRGALEWDFEDTYGGHRFAKAEGLPGPSLARAYLEPLFNPGSPYYIVLLKLTVLPTIEERYGANAGREYIQGTVQFLTSALASNDRLFQWSKDVLMMVVRREVSASALRMEIDRLMTARREQTNEVNGRRILVGTPTVLELLSVSGFSSVDEMFAALDVKLIGRP